MYPSRPTQQAVTPTRVTPTPRVIIPERAISDGVNRATGPLFPPAVSGQARDIADRWNVRLGIAQLTALLNVATGTQVISGHRPGAVIAGTRRPSLHATGNAIDLRGTPEQMRRAAELAAGQPGVTEVIHAGRVWTPRGGWRPVNRADPHNNHVHIGGTFTDAIPNFGALGAGGVGRSVGTGTGGVTPPLGVGEEHQPAGITGIKAGIINAAFYPLLIVLAFISMYIVFKPNQSVGSVSSKIIKTGVSVAKRTATKGIVK